MSSKAESQIASKLDIAKLWLAGLVVAAGVVAFYYFEDRSLLLRVVGLLVVVGVAVAIALMTAKGRVNNEQVLQIARELGLDMDKLKADMEAPEVDQAINKNKVLAKQLGITGTPAFVIGDTVVPGAIDLARLRALVKQARQGS